MHVNMDIYNSVREDQTMGTSCNYLIKREWKKWGGLQRSLLGMCMEGGIEDE